MVSNYCVSLSHVVGGESALMCTHIEIACFVGFPLFSKRESQKVFFMITNVLSWQREMLTDTSALEREGFGGEKGTQDTR